MIVLMITLGKITVCQTSVGEAANNDRINRKMGTKNTDKYARINFKNYKHVSLMAGNNLLGNSSGRIDKGKHEFRTQFIQS